MTPFDFDQNELLSFFAVLVRYSVLVSVLPFVGDRAIPMPVKVLFSVAITLVLFPALVRTGLVIPAQAEVWSSSAMGIATVVGLEALFAGLVRRCGSAAERSRQLGARRDAQRANLLPLDHAANRVNAVAELHAEAAREPLHGEWRFVHAADWVPGAELRLDVGDRQEGARDARWSAAEIDRLVAHHMANAFVVERGIDATAVGRCSIELDSSEP